MDNTFFGQLKQRKESLEIELQAVNALLDLHEGKQLQAAPKANRIGICKSLPDRERVKTVVNIAKDLYAENRRPVSTTEIKKELNKRGFRAPKNGKGHEMISSYLCAQGQMRRQGGAMFQREA